jgi:hypothetical protein
MQNKKIIGVIIICVVVAGISFYGGMKYGQSKNSVSSLASRQGGFNQNGLNPNGGARSGTGMRGAGGIVAGEVLSIDDKSMTVKLRDGGSKIIFFSSSTKVEKTVDGSTADVAIGKEVMVTGTANTDGSINANSIQLRPASPIASQGGPTIVKDIPIKQ